MNAQSQQQRPRKRPRTRAPETGNTTNPPVGPQHNLTQTSWVANPHVQTVRAHSSDTVSQPPASAFPPQHLERSHQAAESDALMNGYSTQQQQQHSQYPDPLPTLAQPQQPDSSSGLNSLNTLPRDNSGANSHHHAHQHQQLQEQHQHHQQQQQQQQQHHLSQQAPSAAVVSKTDRVSFQQYGATQPGANGSPVNVANNTPSPAYNLPVWSVTPSAPSAPSVPPSTMAQSPAPGLAPPPEGIYRSFDDLLVAVQKVAKDQGYGVVKLRASNYREGKPTRYDLVCDRGGVKYASTAKKRNPSTRKIDCPWRAKAVCEVNLGNQWRFAVQEGRHNHEPRIPVAVTGQENTPVAQNMRSITNKIDRLSHDSTQGFARVEAAIAEMTQRFDQRLEAFEKRLAALESGRPQLLAGNAVASMGTPSMPTANMGGSSLGNGGLTNGGGMGTAPLVDNRLNNMDARVSAMEQQRQSMESMPMMDDGMMVNS